MANDNRFGMENALLKQLRNLRIQTSQMAAANAARERVIQEQNVRASQNLKQVNGPQDVLANVRKFLPDYLVPGNLGDVNNVIWPFWFTAQTPELAAATPGTQVQSKSSFTVTQEAAFILLEITKAVFTHTTGPDVFTYVDADNVGATPLTPGLSLILTDAQSRRNFMPTPLVFDHVGSASFPTELPTPLLFLPNSTIEIQLFNSNQTNNYIPWLTFLGVRCRIEDAQRILSTITG